MRLLVYNLIMAAVDLAALQRLRRKRTMAACRAALAGAAVAALLLAAVLGDDVFAAFGLAACGLFLHGVVVLAGSALLLWPTRRKTAIGLAVTAALLVVVAVDAFLIEPTRLEVSHLKITTSKLTRPVRMVVLADLQTDHIGAYQREVFRRALQHNPDLILLAGDYLQAEGDQWEQLCGQLHAMLDRLNFSCPAGVFAVQGNVDPPDWPRMFDGLPITAVPVTRSLETAGLTLTCLAKLDSFDSSLQLDAPDSSRFHVVLGHAPNYALGRVEADLLIAGHTHGGQVRLPLIGPLMTLAEVPRSWAAGLTDLPNGGRLLVSRGVGMERGGAPPLRFLCRPELVVIDVVPAAVSPDSEGRAWRRRFCETAGSIGLVHGEPAAAHE